MGSTVAVTNARAIVIGEDSALVGVGKVDIIDLDKAPSDPGAVVSISLGDYRPTDVTVSKLGNRALIRSIKHTAAPFDPTQSKITVVDVVSRTLLGELTTQGPIPNLGYGWGLNHAEAADAIAITCGQDNPGDGFVQIVDMDPEEVQ